MSCRTPRTAVVWFSCIAFVASFAGSQGAEPTRESDQTAIERALAEKTDAKWGVSGR